MNIVHILIDGLAYDVISKKNTPNLYTLLQQKYVLSTAVIPQTCSITHPNMMSILTGVSQNVHRISSNNISEHSLQIKKNAQKLFSKKLAQPIVLSDDNGLDEFLKEYCGVSEKKFIRFRKPKCAFEKMSKIDGDIVIYFQRLDNAGHKYGWRSKEYMSVLHNIDKDIDYFLKNSSNNFPKLIYISSDHGGIGKSHTSVGCHRQAHEGPSLKDNNTHKKLRAISVAFYSDHREISLIVKQKLNSLKVKKTGTLTKLLTK
jgi:predicted AlkP superfamily pyrophosphatase or phosphodiesterase